MWKWAAFVASVVGIILCVRIILWGEDGRAGRRTKIKQHVPKFMLDLYHQSRNGSDGPDVVRSVIPKSSGSHEDDDDDDDHDKHYLIFDVPSANEDEEFFSAELRILTVMDERKSQSNLFTLTMTTTKYNNNSTIAMVNSINCYALEKLLKLSIYDHADGDLLYLNRFRIRPSNNTWLSINLTNPVEALLSRDGSGHLKVVLSLEAIKLTLLPEDDVHGEHSYPVLLLSYNCHGNPRRKRSLIEFEDDGKRKSKYKNGCRRRPLYVDFAEIDYDSWIVQPSGYEAFQCVGKCFYPLTDHLTPTKHAIVQSLVHSISPLRATRSCCVPTKLNPISILYVDERGVLTYRYAYKDMVVAECGCR
ncbi:PREDICTED: dorsalin-1-like [Nicrophorus vespilloides]|uniref:Dorsalin-1-like n=1 Tax=Nicrophorus vespilloides TaxID=110193 RepID=A0ABM1N1R5_NICVS|nr:PREDICTED: dorsalin-1-like [Nicrophorus vespilloides]